MRIAIMQPYFIPYAGYFRLFAAADLVVLFDCVQFLRRGWMHRNRLPNSNGELQWLTLPLTKQSQDVLIHDLEFIENPQTEWDERLNKFNHIFTKHQNHCLFQSIKNINGDPYSFLERTLKDVCFYLKLPFQIVRSSTLPIAADLKGEDKIISIAKYFNAQNYINLSGGKNLYNSEKFKYHGLKLQFLNDYQGSFASILYRGLTEDPKNLMQDIIQQSQGI